jgi:hypothetical protein
MVLHANERDQPVARRLDLVALTFEMRAKAVFVYLVLDELLGRFLQRLLDLANAQTPKARLAVGRRYHEAGEEMGLARSSAAPNTFVSRWPDQRPEGGRDINR